MDSKFDFSGVGNKPSNAEDTVKANLEIKQSPVKEEEQKESSSSFNEELNQEYIYKRSVTIVPVTNYSLYRRVNSKSLPNRRDCIGSSVASSRVLSSNKNEVDAYFPAIVGLSPNHPDFVFRVKAWLNNISVVVNEIGVTFDTSFRFNRKRDFYAFKTKYDNIEETYEKNKIGGLDKLQRALEIKINDLNILESTLWQFGTPIKVEDYLLYRHCLLYTHVAKDSAIINSSSEVRFYIKDDNKEVELQNKLRLATNNAKVNFVKLLNDSKQFRNIYVLVAAQQGRNVAIAIKNDITTQQNELDHFSQSEPDKFNKLCNDKNADTKATIELLIAHGELIRSAYNQNITRQDGSLVGANIGEAVAWFKDPANTGAVTAYINKLSYI